MKHLLFVTFFLLFGFNVSANVGPNKTIRAYLPEIQVDSAFLNMLNSILEVESQETYYRKDFNYGITFFLDQHGNDCIQIEAIGRRVLKNEMEFGVIIYKGHTFICYGKKNRNVKITEKKMPFDFAIDQTKILDDGTLLLDGIETDRFKVWIFQYSSNNLLQLIIHK